MSWQRDRSASAGLKPVKGKWGDVRVGTLIQGPKGTLDDVWEISDQRSPDQYDYQTTPWFLVTNRATGEQIAIPPKTKTYSVMIMVPEDTVDPEEEKPKFDPADAGPHTPPSDQEAVDLLVTELGAVVEAVKDHETGIVTCPAFEEMPGRGDEYFRHIEVAHGIDLSSVDPKDVVRLTTIHGEAHAKNYASPPSGRGFPHQHGYKRAAKPFGDLQ